MQFAARSAALAVGLATGAGATGEAAGAHIAEAGDKLQDAVAAGLQVRDGVRRGAVYSSSRKHWRKINCKAPCRKNVQTRSAENHGYVVHPGRVEWLTLTSEASMVDAAFVFDVLFMFSTQGGHRGLRDFKSE